MKKKLTHKQLKAIIRECACQAMKNSGMHDVKMIKLGGGAGLFPGMDLDDHDHDDGSHWNDHDQGEKSMILANLAKLSDKALDLRHLAAKTSNNEEWVQEKIAVAAAMIDSIHSYLKYRQD